MAIFHSYVCLPEGNQQHGQAAWSSWNRHSWCCRCPSISLASIHLTWETSGSGQALLFFEGKDSGFINDACGVTHGLIIHRIYIYIYICTYTHNIYLYVYIELYSYIYIYIDRGFSMIIRLSAKVQEISMTTFDCRRGNNCKHNMKPDSHPCLSLGTGTCRTSWSGFLCGTESFR